MTSTPTQRRRYLSRVACGPDELPGRSCIHKYSVNTAYSFSACPYKRRSRTQLTGATMEKEVHSSTLDLRPHNPNRHSSGWRSTNGARQTQVVTTESSTPEPHT